MPLWVLHYFLIHLSLCHLLASNNPPTETRILCSIQSDLSSANESKFIEKNKRFWSLGKHYLKVEYQVRVLIGPADIRFELWFDNQKLSRDQSIQVDWVAAPAPDLSTYNRAELSADADGEARPAALANGLAGGGGAVRRDTAVAVEQREGSGNGNGGQEKKKGGGGLVSMARNGQRPKWPVYG